RWKTLAAAQLLRRKSSDGAASQRCTSPRAQRGLPPVRGGNPLRLEVGHTEGTKDQGRLVPSPLRCGRLPSGGDCHVVPPRNDSNFGRGKQFRPPVAARNALCTP